MSFAYLISQIEGKCNLFFFQVTHDIPSVFCIISLKVLSGDPKCEMCYFITYYIKPSILNKILSTTFL